MLTQKIQEDLIQTLKAQDSTTVAALRLLMAELKNKEIDKRGPLDDDEVVQVIRKQIKELADAKELFQKGGRDDLVTQNTKHIEMLSVYLPAELSDDELKKEIEMIIEKNKELYEKNPKALIGICMKELKPKASAQRILAVLNAL